MTEFIDKEMQESLEDAPEWLRDALESRRVSPGFRERCREAAMVAHSIAVMRKTRAEIGLVPVPLHRFIDNLANKANVAVAPVLKWLGVKSLERPQPPDGRAYAKLGKALGMDEQDLGRHIVASFCFSEGVGPAVLARHGQNKMPLSAAAVIDQMEAELSAGAKQKLRLIKLEIAREYESTS